MGVAAAEDDHHPEEETEDEKLARRTSQTIVLCSHTKSIIVSKMIQPEMFQGPTQLKWLHMTTNNSGSLQEPTVDWIVCPT